MSPPTEITLFLLCFVLYRIDFMERKKDIIVWVTSLATSSPGPSASGASHAEGPGDEVASLVDVIKIYGNSNE